MTTPRTTTDLDGFTAGYAQARTTSPAGLLGFFDPAGSYTHMALRTTYRGHDGILRFHRWMLTFTPASAIRFDAPALGDGVLYLEWLWTRSFDGPLRLPDGSLIASNERPFAVPGVAACCHRDDGTPTVHPRRLRRLSAGGSTSLDGGARP